VVAAIATADQHLVGMEHVCLVPATGNPNSNGGSQ
jgi:hypothetical protein